MPQSQLKTLAAKYGVPFETVEAWWAEERDRYGEDFEAVMGSVMKRLRNHKRAHAEAVKRH